MESFSIPFLNNDNTNNNINEKLNKLKVAKYDDLNEYELKGTHDIKIIRVWDGDTFYVAMYYENDIYKVNCRLLGVDTPEIPRDHDNSLTEESKKAYFARDKVIELLTNIEIDHSKEYFDSMGNKMPSITSNELQPLMDKNTELLLNSLSIHGRDKYGRYLVRVKTKYGDDLSETLIKENVALPYMVEK